jgi:hypothetical protein
MRFEERELNPYAEHVTANRLREGEVYLSVQYADEHLLIPIIETWVFAGRKLDPDDPANHLYFQDVESYLQGIRYSSATPKNATFEVALEGETNHFFEYERALEELMKCSLRRRKLSA